MSITAGYAQKSSFLLGLVNKVNNMKLSEILFRAYDVQLTQGRAVGMYGDRNGCVCIVGAIRVARTGGFLDKNSPMNYVENYVAKALGYSDYTGLYDFNDRICTTKEETAAALILVAQKAALEGL